MDRAKRRSGKEERGDLSIEPITRRLDALLRLAIELAELSKLGEDKGGFNDAVAARLLKSAGLKPTEIAKVFGKEKASDISPYLYPKKE